MFKFPFADIMVSRAGRAVLASSLLLAACGGGDSTTSPSPGNTTAPVTTENFTGTFPLGGGDFKTFNVVLSNGQLTATLTKAGPPDNVVIGFALGTFSAGTCSLISGAMLTTAAGTAPQLAGPVSAGSYCVAVGDAGFQTGDVTYSVTVTHY